MTQDPRILVAPSLGILTIYFNSSTYITVYGFVDKAKGVTIVTQGIENKIYKKYINKITKIVLLNTFPG